MGAHSLEGMLEVADFDASLRWHLASNHYPPVPSVMVEPCKVAIANAQQADWDTEVELPAGVLYRGSNTCPTHALIEGLHLGQFIDWRAHLELFGEDGE